MLLLIDNYDSFTYNLAQYLGELGQEVRVVRNDEISVDEVGRFGAEWVVLSPGPGTPAESRVCLTLLERLAAEKGMLAGAPMVPILGVCLGHQAIAQAFGGKVVRGRAIHGQVWPVYPTDEPESGADPLLRGLSRPFWATRYHSLVVEPGSLPECLVPTAFAAEGELMAMRHRTLPLYGVQFHPESIGTPEGKLLLENFLSLPTPAG